MKITGILQLLEWLHKFTSTVMAAFQCQTYLMVEFDVGVQISSNTQHDLQQQAGLEQVRSLV